MRDTANTAPGAPDAVNAVAASPGAPETCDWVAVESCDGDEPENRVATALGVSGGVIDGGSKTQAVTRNDHCTCRF